MARSTYRPGYTDTTRPLPFQLRFARFMTAPAGDAGAGAPAGQGSGDAGEGEGGEAGTAGQAGTEEAAGAQSVDELPDWAQKIIRDTRAEAASHRTKANEATTAQQQTLDSIAKALGLKSDGDDAPTVEGLTEQLTAATTESTEAKQAARQAQVELAVYRAAGTHSGDPAALLDSRAFLEKVTALDPTAEDFTTQVDAAIKAAVDANPKLKTVQAAARSGQDFTGGTGEGRTRTPKPLNDAVASAYGN